MVCPLVILVIFCRGVVSQTQLTLSSVPATLKQHSPSQRQRTSTGQEGETVSSGVTTITSFTDNSSAVTLSINFTLCDFYCSVVENNTSGENTTALTAAAERLPSTVTQNYFVETTPTTFNGTESPIEVQDRERCDICKARETPEVPLTAKTLYYIRTTERIWRFCPPLLFLIGTVGNFLSAVVMLRKSLRSSMTSFFLVILAFVDTLMLWTGLLRHYLRNVHSIKLRSVSTFGCKLHIFLVYCLGQFAAWILVMMTMERFFAIFSPHKAKQYITKTTCALAVGITGTLLAGINGHFFVSYHILQPQNICYAKDKFDSFMNNEWTWIDFAFFSFIPFGVLIVANMGIVARIGHSNYVRKHTMKQTSGGVKMTSMTAILLTVSFMFLITTSPISIYLVIQESILRELTPEEDALNGMWWAIVVNVSYINHAFNFFLYCFSGPRFRRELRFMFFGDTKVYPATVTMTQELSAAPTAAQRNESNV